MRRSRVLVLALVLFAVPQALPRAADATLVARAEDSPVEEAERLTEEARGFFQTSGDTDLPRKERKEARREAYVRLKAARKLLDDWLDGHPEDTESLDGLYVQIASMMYWVKKEASLGEFGPSNSGGSKAGGGTKPGRKPGKQPGGKPAPGKDPKTPEQPPEPEEPKGPTATDVLGEIEAYGTSHPGDVPGLHERYTEFLSEFPDRATPEYAQAVERLAVLGERLKDVYRLARDDDPDALKNVDDAQVKQLVAELSDDLESDEEAVRVRAARFLGGLGTGEAADPLLDALVREKEGDVYDAAVDSLAKIGGRRVCRRLGKVKRKSPLAPAVVDIYTGMVARGGVNARIAGEALATYVRAFDEERQHAAAEALFEAGDDGALGLSMLLDAAPNDRKLPYIEHLGGIADARTAGPLASFLVVNARGAAKKRNKAAKAAILKIGKPGVKYLIPVLDDERNRLWTAEMLRRITGAKPKDDKRKSWEKWYRKNRRALEAE